MALINCKISIMLTFFGDFVISSANGATKFAIIDKKLYVSVVILSIQDNTKLLEQLELDFF